MNESPDRGPAKKLDAHVVLCTGFIPPYALPVYQAIHRRLRKLSILISTPMERNRRWQPDWGDLDVRVQRTWTRTRRWKHAAGFEDIGQTHLPLDTFGRLRSLQPDVIVSEELGFRSLQCAIFQRFRPHVPLVLVCNLSEHTEMGRGRVRLWLRKWLARRSHVTLVNGVSGRRYLESIGFPPTRLHLFPYVSQPGVFDGLPLERPDAVRRHLVVCGELSERKGLARLIEVLDAWAGDNLDQSLRCAFVGDGPLRASLAQIPRRSNFKLEFLGFCDYPKIRGVFSRSSLLAFPTLADEWGLVVNEALAAGLPVLGSIYSQAVEELIVEGRNGWRFRPDDRDDFRQTVNRALAVGTAELNAMRYNGRQSVAERTPEWAAEKFIAAIAESLQPHVRKPI